MGSLTGWRLIRVEGGDRIRFLHSQLTSDVRGLAPGSSQPTALLDRSGRLRAWGFLHRRENDLLLLAEGDPAAAFVEALRASVIADDVELAMEPARPVRLALGPLAMAASTDLDPERTFPVAGWGSRGLATWDPSPIPGVEAGEYELELLHAMAGPPRWRREAFPGQLVNETTLLADAVAFDKGCYLGQETVAKVASRRGAATSPMLIAVNSGFEALAPGLGFAVEDRPRAGVIRSLVVDGERRVAHAGLCRELQLPGRAFEGRLEGGEVFRATVLGPAFAQPPSVVEMAGRLFQLAVRLFAADREEEAARLLTRVIELDPSASDAYESLGVIHGRHGRYEEAIALMRRLLEVDLKSVMAHTNLSLYHNRLGRIAEAEEEARLAAAAAIGRQRSERERAEAERRARADAEAERRRRGELFRRVLEIDPDDATASFGLGELALEDGDFARAAGHLERTLAADPRYSAAFLALGRACEGLGDTARARDVYRRGLEVALSRGDLQPANRMQERLQALSEERHRSSDSLRESE